MFTILRNYSQQIALISFIGSSAASYFLHDKYEKLLKRTIVNPFLKVSSEYDKISSEICQDLKLNEKEYRVKLHYSEVNDVFSTGSSTNASIVLPYYFSIFHKVHNRNIFIPRLKNTPLFTTDSPLGRKFLLSLYLPHDMKKFLIARELLRLLGVDSSISKENNHFPSKKNLSVLYRMITISSFYGAYQIIYFLSKRPGSRAKKSSINLFVFGLIIACQNEIIQMLKKRYNNKLDRAVIELGGENYLKAGLEYYEWRREFNKILLKIDDVLIDKKNNVNRQTERKDEYLIPNAYLETSTEDYLKPYNLSNGSKYYLNGSEIWCTEGDVIGFNPSASFHAIGMTLPFISSFFNPFFSPLKLEERIDDLKSFFK